LNKNKADKLITRFLETVGEEETELVRSPDGTDVIATKAESLARIIWKRALGYTETLTGAGGKLQEKIHSPNTAMMHIIFERIEGKVQGDKVVAGENMTVADRIGEQGKKAINEVTDAGLESSVGNSSDDKG